MLSIASLYFQATKKCFTVEQAACVLAESDSEFENDLVVIPPVSMNDDDTDEEDINETDLGVADIHDVPGDIEMFEADINENKRKYRKVEQLKTEVKWKRGNKLDHKIDGEPPKLTETHPLLSDKTPIELFRLFFDGNIIELIRQETIRYAHQKGEHNFNTGNDEIFAWLGIILLSGYHSVPQEDMYWSKDEDLMIKCVSERISRSRFREIKQYFHLQNNSELDNTDKLAKLRTFMTLLHENLQQFGFFEKELSLGESMVSYYGHHSAKCL